MWRSFALAAGLLLAGCSDPAPEADDSADFSDLQLEASASTGIIRGVVVDAAIRPIAGAAIALRGDSAAPQTTTDAGTFGFDGLAPGTYFLIGSKPGYVEVQQSVDVVAGVAEPKITKLLLPVDASFIAPYVETYVLDGFIECGVTTPVVAGAVCSFGEIAGQYNLTNDHFNQFIPVGSVPMFIQHELIWEATQSTGNMFNLAARTATQEQFDGGSYEGGIKSAVGLSPVVIRINATEIEEDEVGVNGTGLAPAVFSGGMEGTGPCVPEPVGCFFATGATIEQSFRLYTHIFYGYAPPEAWQFSIDGQPPPPA